MPKVRRWLDVMDKPSHGECKEDRLAQLRHLRKRIIDHHGYIEEMECMESWKRVPNEIKNHLCDLSEDILDTQKQIDKELEGGK